jgi:uncharacterized protein (UPF0261 family)
MDTKGEEASYLEKCLIGAGLDVLILDPGIRGTCGRPVAVSRDEVAQAAGKTLEEIQSIGHEGKALEAMTGGAILRAQALYRENRIKGVIGLGGSMGTTLGTAVMRSFPIGFPKVMVSTMASRNTRPFVGTKDILMLYAVCDLSGLNRITRKVLLNGALAMAGMVQGEGIEDPGQKPLLILSTLGTTEACSTQVQQHFEAEGYEVIVFHTVGAGGQALEETVGEGEVSAVVDLSLHEMADHLFGGDYDAGRDRGKTALAMKVPTVLVPGNIDFLAAGPLDEARRRFPNRRYHQHNQAITLLRTSREELEKLARIVADLANKAEGPLAIMIPLGGFSALDCQESPLHDPEGPRIFAETVRQRLSKAVPLTVVPHHINDPEFALLVAETMKGLLKRP